MDCGTGSRKCAGRMSFGPEGRDDIKSCATRPTSSESKSRVRSITILPAWPVEPHELPVVWPVGVEQIQKSCQAGED